MGTVLKWDSKRTDFYLVTLMRNALIPHFLCQAEKPAWGWGREADVVDADWRALTRQVNMVGNQEQPSPFPQSPRQTWNSSLQESHLNLLCVPTSQVVVDVSMHQAPGHRSSDFCEDTGASLFLSRAGSTMLYSPTASSCLYWRNKITGCWEHSEQDLHPTWASGLIFC